MGIVLDEINRVNQRKIDVYYKGYNIGVTYNLDGLSTVSLIRVSDASDQFAQTEDPKLLVKMLSTIIVEWDLDVGLSVLDLLNNCPLDLICTVLIAIVEDHSREQKKRMQLDEIVTAYMSQIERVLDREYV